ncbi:hypothetical protein QBC44DRAFT_364095 [Cladorrhinum sp. PSN332]|nr:hypothetical protein QBC44DRAFT_364095 [Cladorrhinum sp. PSN332]
MPSLLQTPPPLLSIRQLVTSNSGGSDGGGLTTAQIVGITVSAIVAAIIFILAVWLYARARGGIKAVMSKGNPHHGRDAGSEQRGREKVGTNNPVCLTRTIFAYPSASESWSLVLCTPSGRPTTESLFLETTAPGSSPSTASLPSPTSGVPNLPSSTTSGGNTPPSSTPVDQLEEAQSTSSESKAWIAGAVIGPIVAIAIVGFIGYWFGIRRARKKGDLQVEGQGPPSGPDQVQVPGMQNHHHGGGYYDPKAAAAGPPGASEMAGSIPPPGGSGADHSKPYYAGNYPANLDSNPVHELSHTSQAYELPADNTGHNHQERDR